MKPVCILLPHHKNESESADERSAWLASLPELELLAPLRVLQVPWSNAVAGNQQDSLQTVSLIQRNWDEAEGFVVWAPQASLLELAGTASLFFQQAGKPVIFFAASNPDLKTASELELAGLKSQLINAVYIACADLGEVGVLIGQSLFRPSACAWSRQGSGFVPASSGTPLATIDFRLHLRGDHAHRTGNLELAQPPQAPAELAMVTWYPQSRPTHPSPGASAVMVTTDSSFWDHPAMQAWREQLLQDTRSFIWFSREPWPEASWKDNEIGISHQHLWWAALVAHYALSAFPNQSAPTFDLIRRSLSL